MHSPGGALDRGGQPMWRDTREQGAFGVEVELRFAPAALDTGATRRAGRSGSQSGARQPAQRNGQPCTHTAARSPGPSVRVPPQVAATLTKVRASTSICARSPPITLGSQVKLWLGTDSSSA